MGGREQLSVADLAMRLHSIAKHCESDAKAAADGLPAGFTQVDDVIVLLQPVQLATADKDEATLESILRPLATRNFLTGSQAVGEGGIVAALMCGCAPRGFGFHVALTESEGTSAEDAMFRERYRCAFLSTRPKAHMPLANFIERGGQYTAEAIGRVTAGDIRVQWLGKTLLEAEKL